MEYVVGASLALGVAAFASMAGFDRDRARQALSVPADYDVEAMVALGRPGDPDRLPPKLRDMEAPSGRKKVDEIAREGPFAF